MESQTQFQPDLQQQFDLPVGKWAMWMAAFLVFVVVMTGKVRYTEGDSRYSLLATTALIEHGNLRLDPYATELDLDKLNHGHNWMIFRSGEASHFYYDYPVGTQILALPFVWVGRQLGMNPLVIQDDTSMQIGIAAILCVCVFLLLYRLSRLYLGEWAALLFSLALFFGTTLTSTLGTALWSHNFQTLITLLVVLELAEWERGVRPRIRGRWLGFLLFMAYLCRPTSAALIVPVFGYLAWKDRKSLPWVAGIAAGLFGLFVLWSKLELNMILPRYYDPTLWNPGKGFWEHWLPLWFGPARGLWAFSPALLLVFAGWAFKKIRFQPLHLLFWVWLLLHTYLLMRSQSPWAGWSFGPRFFTELIPGIACVLLLVASQLQAAPVTVRNGMLGGFLALSGFGVYVHTFQGLNNIETQAWNDNPNIDHHWSERRWDWRHPQFLASGQQRAALTQEVALEQQMQQLTWRIPEKANILFGQPDPIIRECFLRWNREDRFKKSQTLCNSLTALQNHGAKEFWFSSSQLKEVLAIPNVQVDSSAAQRLCLGDFLKVNEKHEIFLAGMDESSNGAALETRQYFYSVASKYDSLKMRESYLAHLKGGKLIHEEWGPRKLEYISKGIATVRVQSAGLFQGNFASITVNGREYSPNLRGINVLVLDDQRDIVWATSFDTHADDHERFVLMRATLR